MASQGGVALRQGRRGHDHPIRLLEQPFEDLQPRGVSQPNPVVPGMIQRNGIEIVVEVDDHPAARPPGSLDLARGSR